MSHWNRKRSDRMFEDFLEGDCLILPFSTVGEDGEFDYSCGSSYGADPFEMHSWWQETDNTDNEFNSLDDDILDNDTSSLYQDDFDE